MNRIRLFYLGLYLITVLMLSACVGSRGDFPSWLVPPVSQVSSELGSNDSDMPAIFSDSGDNVLVAWSSDPAESATHSDTEIYWRRYDNLGRPQTPPIRLTYNAFGDYYPSIGMSEGITYLAWMGDETESSNIYWAAVDQDGNITEGPLMISDPDENDYDPHLIQCGDYSHVYWYGDSPANDYEIYYAKIRYNGIMDVPYKSVSNLSKPEQFPHGEIDLFCSNLFIAYEYVNDYSPKDTNVYLVGIDTSDGSTAFSPVALAATAANEYDIDVAVNSPLFSPTLISVVWTRDDAAGGDIYYASRNYDGSVCTAQIPLLDDSQFDAHPVVENLLWNNNRYALVFWERIEPGTGTDRDIYASFLTDDCSPPSPGSPILISESTISQASEDVYPQVVARLAPDGRPIFAALWRTESDGSVWSRFGSLGIVIGASDLISDDDSAGYPVGVDRPAPVVALGDQLFVSWVGNNLGTVETWYQQTAWHFALPVILK